ncbi:MAG TPA: flagellar basal body-associated FliL family protein [Paracoccaceae bacterium]|nr:flagellar basal body-associated FliL family protein [Paracoccaceae bacterium]HMO73051.1 flagellar basal body-associated FliL family protein [Paracoccaceae bacterium]
MRRLMPILLVLAGLAAGAGAGLALRPLPPASGDTTAAPPVPASPPDYVRLSNQFVVPVVEGGRVAAMVILSLSLEVAPGGSEAIYAREPRLRDAFLQILFDHANAGGFRGAFTDGSNLVVLRGALRETGQRLMPDTIRDVLIADIVRQDG